ncbi:proline and serine-rich protein 2 [Clarias magur]|uniref:Proline and serine-rich protein 2 n=1 Tax=Clarias magur TaxID=1594786 RepID=A0A8J4TTL0_CLAMG|nr:proline and serine-rich protein 2 [Clarias magur]
MDVHVHGNPRLHYKLNGYQQSKDDGLQFLSSEEKECILFFEETIDSLEDGFDDTTGRTPRKIISLNSLRASSSSALSSAPRTNVSPNVMEHDIIDLVRPSTNFTVQDFSNLSVSDPHQKTPKNDPVGYEENHHARPPGSVPTPVVIASKISEHQGSGGITPSTLLGRRRSLESKRDPSMHPRNPHLPSKITLTRGHQELNAQSLATAAVNVQERRSQMLANLPEGSHPLEGGEPACVRNVPTRSVSFNDMAPEKSRVEALSKLGLVAGKTTHSPPNIGTKLSSNSISPNSSTYQVSSSPYSTNSPISNSNKASVSMHAHTSNNITVSNIIGQRKNSNPSFNQSTYEAKPKSEIAPNNFSYYGGKTATITPIKDTSPSFNKDRRSSAEVNHTDFNSYGGKSTILNPSLSVKAESVSSPYANAPEPPETQFNSYGGRSKVINPSLSTDEPDSAHSHSTTNTGPTTTYHGDPTRSRYQSEKNSYNVKPKVLTPVQTDPVSQPIVRTRPFTVAPPTAPRPQGSTSSLRTRPEPVPPEILSKPAPSFRNQGVTVQFNGKATTGEARQDALRRLGLLKKKS